MSQPATTGSKPVVPADANLEDRFRRMEEAFLRLEENHREIQGQYKALLRKYDDLSRKMTTTQGARGVVARNRAQRVSRTTANGSIANTPGGNQVVADPISDLPEPLGAEMNGGAEAVAVPPADPSFAQPPAGAEGTGGRTNPRQQPATPPAGAEGEIGRGTGPTPTMPRTQPAEESRSTMSRMDRIGAGAEGTGGRTSPRQQPAAVSEATAGAEGKEGEAEEKSRVNQGPVKHKGHFAFGEGLEFESDDKEFLLQFHNLTQAEFRGFDNRDLGVLNDQFFIPRQRWYFVGNLTKNVGFYTVINRGYGSLDLLDAFITLRFSDKLRLRVGRMKTPYLYEYFSIAEGDLIAPERSLFAGNLALNRQMGFMFLGELFDSRVSYATGLYNGPRRSFQDLNSAKDIIGNVTIRPFLNSERFKALNYFNIGGSWDVGYQNNSPPQPVYFETANDQTPNNATSLSPTFLHLNNNVIELGERVQWGGHLVWYYKSLFLMAEYGGLRSGYGIANGNTSTPVNMSGTEFTASYFLTGEQVTRRVNMVKPLRDFNFDFLTGKGAFSPGAVEVYARYSNLNIGRNIFTSGFADPNLWTNHVWATDVGLNWYLNFYLRVYLDWQHSEFGNPVSMAPGKFSSTADLYWLRFQVFF